MRKPERPSEREDRPETEREPKRVELTREQLAAVTGGTEPTSNEERSRGNG